MELPKRFQVLADALCMRIQQAHHWASIERPVEKAKLEREVIAYETALGMLLQAVEPPKYPTLDCALNVSNNPKMRDAWTYYQTWLENGARTM